jgi:hypothetical protein
LNSPEKEQLFTSGGHYVSRISEIMQENYPLTRLDYLHCRSWTRGYSEFNFHANDVELTMRDVGGDELNREQHWGNAIKDSFCVLFVVSLCDYRRMEIGGRTSGATTDGKANAKFRHIRSMLWDYLIHETNPKIVLLCNKQDLFREQLKGIPLHKGCKEFRNVAPQAAGEIFEAYCERCEKEVLKYFKKCPSAIANCENVNKRKDADNGFNIKDVHLHGAFVTQATDEALFGEVKKKLTNIFIQFFHDAAKSSNFI